MASIINEPNGRKTIQFTAPNGNRPKIRIPQVKPRRGETSKRIEERNQRRAEAFRDHVEELLTSRSLGRSPHATTVTWLDKLDTKMKARLIKVGLLDQDQAAEHAELAILGPFLDAYIKSRTDVKESTRSIYRDTRRTLAGFFGESRAIASITARDAERYRAHLLESGNAKTTTSRRIQQCKQFFTAAVKDRLITADPFGDEKVGSMKNKKRQRFISREDIWRVLDACPHAQWRLIVAMARFGGIRTPSETMALRWSDVNWAENRILIRSKKTEHHDGGESRLIPLFPELVPYLQEAFEEAEPGTDQVITFCQGPKPNWRPKFEAIIRQAGLEPWPKLFNNLRSSRQTELEDIHPGHVVSAWMGNSEKVAREHYLQITDSHFARAIQTPSGAVQKTVQHGHTLSHTEEHGPLVCHTGAHENTWDADRSFVDESVGPTSGGHSTGCRVNRQGAEGRAGVSGG